MTQHKHIFRFSLIYVVLINYLEKNVFACLGKCDVTSVSERSDDQSRSVSQVFVPISKFGVANVRVTVGPLVVPPMSKLRLPHEGERALDLVGDQLADDVAGVDVDGADRHDLLAVAAR